MDYKLIFLHIKKLLELSKNDVLKVKSRTNLLLKNGYTRNYCSNYSYRINVYSHKNKHHCKTITVVASHRI